MPDFEKKTPGIARRSDLCKIEANHIKSYPPRSQLQDAGRNLPQSCRLNASGYRQIRDSVENRLWRARGEDQNSTRSTGVSGPADLPATERPHGTKLRFILAYFHHATGDMMNCAEFLLILNPSGQGTTVVSPGPFTFS